MLLIMLVVLIGASNQSLFQSKHLRDIKRSLATNDAFGGYTINRGELPSECDSYTYDEIQFSEQEFREGIDNLNMYSFAKEAVDKYAKTQDEDEFKDQIGPAVIRVIANVIFFLLAFIFFFVFLIYFFCNCLNKICCCCCDDEESLKDAPGDSAEIRKKKAIKRAKRSKRIKKMASTKCRKIIVGCSLLLVVAITILGIIWGVFMFKAIAGVKRTNCSVGYTFENIKEGIRSDDITFGGLNGVKYLLDQIGTSLNNIQASDLTAISTQDLETKGTEAYNSLETFYNAVSGSPATYSNIKNCDTGAAGTFVPDHIANLKNNFNDEVAKEFEAMRDNGKSLQDAATNGALAISTQKTEYLKVIDDFKKNIDTYYKQIDDYQDKFEQDGKNNTYINLTKAAAWVIMIGTFACMILYLLLMGCSLKGKCHNFSTFFQALLAIFKMFFAIIMNLVAAVSIAISIALINICYAADKSMNDANYTTLIDDSLKDLMNTCILPSGDGNVANFVDDTTKLDNLVNMTQSFGSNWTSLNPRDGKTAASEALELYDTNYFSKLQSYETSDFQITTANDPMTKVNSLNSATGNGNIACMQDKIAPVSARCPSGYPASTASTGTDDNNTSNLCIDLSSWTFAFGNNGDSTNRYRTGTCVNGGTTATTAEGLKQCTKDLSTKLTAFKTPLYNTATYPNQKAATFYTAIGTIKTNFESVSSAMSSAISVFSDVQSGISTFVNCTIIRSELQNTFGNTCVKFGKNFAKQAIILAIIGPLFWLLSFCVCCSFSQSKALKELKALKKQHKKDNGGNSIMSHGNKSISSDSHNNDNNFTPPPYVPAQNNGNNFTPAPYVPAQNHGYNGGYQ